MKLLLRICVFLLVMAFVSGCASSSGALLENSAISKLKEGMSRAEVHEILGKPQSTHRGSNRKLLDIYGTSLTQQSFSQGMWRAASGEIETRTLSLVYSPEEKVERYLHSVGSVVYHQVRPNLIQGGTRIRLQDTNGIIRGRTKKSALVDAYGPPSLEGLFPDGNTECRWDYFEVNAARKVTLEAFHALVNSQGIVVDFRFSSR